MGFDDDDDDDENDVFFLEQIKPVNRLTLNDAIRAKRRVLAKYVGNEKPIQEIVLLDDIEETPVGSKSTGEENTHVSGCQSVCVGDTSSKKNDNSESVLATNSVKKCEVSNLAEASKDAPESSKKQKKVKKFEKKQSLKSEDEKKKNSKAFEGRKKKGALVTTPETTPRKRKRKISEVNSPTTSSNSPKTIKDYFSPVKQSPEKLNKSPNVSKSTIKCPENVVQTPVVPNRSSEALNVSPEVSNEDPHASIKTPEKSSKSLQESKIVNISFIPEPSSSNLEASENIKNSPGIAKRQNKLIIPESLLPNTSKASEPISGKKRKNVRKTLFLGVSGQGAQDDITKENKSNGIVVSTLYYEILRRILYEEMENQLQLKKKRLVDDKAEDLFLPSEVEILERFFKIDESSQKLYARMLNRKKSWFRISEIKYPDISGDLRNEFDILITHNLVDHNFSAINLKSQLEMLYVGEVKQLCKVYGVPINNNCTRKEELIDALLSSNRSQRSVADLFGNANGSVRTDKLRDDIFKLAGPCIKLNEEVLAIFNRWILLFSLAMPDIQEEEEKRCSITFFLMREIQMGVKIFPNYTMSRTVIFQTRRDFLEYEQALWLQNKLDQSFSSKDYNSFCTIVDKAKKRFSALLKDEEFIDRTKSTPHFLLKYNAGSVYARILTSYCQFFKKKTGNDKIIPMASFLLDQKIFLTHKRGLWYEILAQAYSSDLAAQIIIVSQNDECAINEVQTLTLQIRAQMILNKKTNGITKGEIKEKLDDMATTSVVEPPIVVIKGAALEDNVSGHKSVFVQQNINGKSYSTVEELAITYYKTKGFTHGIHAEGAIIQTIYFLLFFDIIYGFSPPGVFQSPYQLAPLDLYSRSFYFNRKEAIDKRLDEIPTWTPDKVETLIEKVIEENRIYTCIVEWDQWLPQHLSEIIQCVGLRAIRDICERFVKNFGMTRSGFPDLTLWNPQSRKCKFVEVKGPKDKLAPNQRIWLDFLRKIEVDCEVCQVKSSSCSRLSY